MTSEQTPVTVPARLAVVMPCYNEEEALPATAQAVEKLFSALQADGLISGDSYALLVNDGSRDKTWSVIEGLHNSNSLFRGLKLSRNFGHQSTLR